MNIPAEKSVDTTLALIASKFRSFRSIVKFCSLWKYFMTNNDKIVRRKTFTGSTTMTDSKKERKKEDSHSSDFSFPHSMLYKIRKKLDDTTLKPFTDQAITRFIELKINQFIVAWSNFFVLEYSFRKLAMYGTGFTTIVLPFQKGDYLCCHEKSWLEKKFNFVKIIGRSTAESPILSLVITSIISFGSNFQKTRKQEFDVTGFNSVNHNPRAVQ